jgi:hypothetical protein
MSLPISGDVVHEIATLLAHLDEDGRTTTAGVTTLTLPEAGEVAAPPVRARRKRAETPA